MLDANFALSVPWGRHIQSDGSNIAPGSPDPVNAGYLQAPPGFPNGLLLFNEGKAYTAFEIYTQRAMQPNTGRLTFEYDLTDLGDFYGNAQVNETDTIFVANKQKFNVSAQRIAKTNMMQVSNQGGGWIDTGFVAPALVPGVPMHHSFMYGLDLATGHYGVQAMTIGGVEFILPFQLQELTALPTTWADGVYPQLQNCLGPNGGKVRLLFENLRYTWA